MSKRSILKIAGIFIVLMYSSGVFAGELSGAKTSLKKPKIVFQETVYDFGIQESGASLKHTFVFKNEGSADLIIKKVKGVCRCTVAISSDKTIPPGGTGRIDVTFDTKGYEGERSKKVTVFSNDPDNGMLNLEVKANLIVYFDTNKHRLYFGRIDSTSQKITESLLFRGVDLKKAELGKIYLEDDEYADAIKWELIDHRQDKENPSLTLDITLDPKKMIAGRFVTNLFIETVSPAKKKIKVLLAGHILGPVSCHPSRLYFGSFEPGKTYEKKITIQSKTDAFKILKIESGSPALHCVYDEKAPASTTHEITITFSPEATMDKIKTKIIIKTDMEIQKEISIPVHGFQKREHTVGVTSAETLKSNYHPDE